MTYSPSEAALVKTRHEFACNIVASSAELALSFFQERESLDIEVKGLQDWVSNADKSVEDAIRLELGKVYPDDAIVGEEHGQSQGTSGFVWVIDPIDGTTNFVSGTPGWCVVLACLYQGVTVSAVICDPVSNETYKAVKGEGATLNGKPISASSATALDQGTLGVGHSVRVSAASTVALLSDLLQRQGLFRRGGSGALDLSYVAAGRLLGFAEPHMNAWDCLAAILLIEEAGAQVQEFDMDTMLASGGSVVAACPGVYKQLVEMCDAAYHRP
ncbi:MAG: inositol monophosphatase [Granulosicoccus sp.]